MRLLHPSARYDALTRARHRAFMAPRLLGSLAAFAAFPVYLAMRGAPTRARGRGVRLADRADPAVVVPVAHRPLRGRACAVVAGAGGPRHDGGDDHRRHRILCRDLAGRGSARGGALGVAPRGRVCLGAGAVLRRAADRCSDISTCCRRPRPARRCAACSWRSASRRRRSMPRALPSAPNRWRAPASRCSMSRKTAIACWRAT